MRVKLSEHSKSLIIKGGVITGLALFVVLITSTIVHSIDVNLPTPMATSISYTQPKMVDLINQVRSKAGKPPLTEDTALDQAATARNQFIIEHKEWNHNGSDGSHWYTIVESYAPDRDQYGENLAGCMKSNEDVVNAWVGSPEHYAIMIGDFTRVGFSTVYAKDTLTNTYASPNYTFSNCYIVAAEFSN